MINNHTIDDLIAIVFELQERVRVLESENASLRARVTELESENAELRAKLGGGGKKEVAPPEWVKGNTPDQPKKERKNRGTAYCRRRQTPTRIVEHAHDTCPDCGRSLSGGTLHHSRQVIEIPPVSVEVIEHQYISRHCGVCKKNYVPKVDLSGEVIGTHRIGIRLMSLVSYLTITARVPKWTICRLLKSLFDVDIGYGEINTILHSVAKRCKGEADQILSAVRESPWMHADETGWRENGKNGYIWSLSTPDLRYCAWNRSRGGQVAKDLIGETYGGVVVSDFYAGYSVLLCRHQRCWVHFLRDLRKLKEDHPDDRGVDAWVKKIRKVYRDARVAADKDAKDRIKLRRRFETRLLGIAEPYLKMETPQRVLAKRIERFASEMFVFLEDPRIPSENNAAERAVRPAVIARKVCGGTRSGNGTETKMILMSLFGTWLLRGLDGIESCRSLLSGHSVIFPESA
jgi:transposase